TSALRTASRTLRRFDDRADLMYRYAINQRRVKAIVGVGRSPSSSLMRIRPDPAHIRPSLREAQLPPLGLEEPKIVQLTEEEKALFSRAEKGGLDPSSIGTLLKERSPDGYLLVKRPDGRVRRFFTVEGIKEAKKTGKRDNAMPAVSLLQEGE